MLLITSSINSSSINSKTVDDFTSAPAAIDFDNGCREWSFAIWMQIVDTECYTIHEEFEIAFWLWDLCNESGGPGNMQKPVFIE